MCFSSDQRFREWRIGKGSLAALLLTMLDLAFLVRDSSLLVVLLNSGSMLDLTLQQVYYLSRLSA
jgi:hypothetical protein